MTDDFRREFARAPRTINLGEIYFVTPGWLQKAAGTGAAENADGSIDEF